MTEAAIAALERKVEKHDEDLYYGRGKSNPSITTRITSLEEGMESGMKELTEIRKTVTWAARTLVLILLGIVIDIFKNHK